MGNELAENLVDVSEDGLTERDDNRTALKESDSATVRSNIKGIGDLVVQIVKNIVSPRNKGKRCNPFHLIPSSRWGVSTVEEDSNDTHWMINPETGKLSLAHPGKYVGERIFALTEKTNFFQTFPRYQHHLLTAGGIIYRYKVKYTIEFSDGLQREAKVVQQVFDLFDKFMNQKWDHFWYKDFLNYLQEIATTGEGLPDGVRITNIDLETSEGYI